MAFDDGTQAAALAVSELDGPDRMDVVVEEVATWLDEREDDASDYDKEEPR